MKVEAHEFDGLGAVEDTQKAVQVSVKVEILLLTFEKHMLGEDVVHISATSKTEHE